MISYKDLLNVLKNKDLDLIYPYPEKKEAGPQVLQIKYKSPVIGIEDSFLVVLVPPDVYEVVFNKKMNAYLVQFIYVVQQNIQDSLLEDVKTLLDALNKKISIPGFGIDQASKKVYYGYTQIIASKKGLDVLPTTLDILIQMMSLYTPAIMGVASGELPLSHLMPSSQI